MRISDLPAASRFTVGDSGSDQVAAPHEAEVWEPGWLIWRVLVIGKKIENLGFRRGDRIQGCLPEFVRLTDASDEQIAGFARRRGVLGFCVHGLPGAHAVCPPAWCAGLVPCPQRTAELAGFPGGRIWPSEWYFDKIDDWRKLAREFKAVMAIAISLEERQPTNPADWFPLFSSSGRDREEFIRRGGPQEWDVATYVNALVDQAGITLGIEWREDRYDVHLRYGGLRVAALKETIGMTGLLPFLWPEGSLYPILVGQLAAAIANKRLTACGECHRLFDWLDAGLQRTPRTDKDALCGDQCREERQLRQGREWKRKFDAKNKK